MVRVLLLNPPANLTLYKEDRCQNQLESHLHKVIRPPISLMGLAAIAEELGHQTKIIDAPIEHLNLKQLTKFLNRWKPNWVVINASLETLKSDILSLKIAKEYGAKTVVFGYAPTSNDVEILRANSFIDFAIRREPEKTFQELLNDSLHLSDIKGLTFRDNNVIKQNEDRDFIENLDILPFPAHHLINNNLYRVPTTGEKFTTIQTSRGCPHQCTFCLSNFLNGFKIRQRSVNSIIEEIKLVISNLSISNFFFRADNFTSDKQWVLKLCHDIIKNNLKISWFCNSRIDTVDQEILQIMKKTGCELITFGVESGNSRILDYIQKGIKKAQVKRTFDLTKKYAIPSGAFYILGLPGDTINSIHETIQFSKEVDSDGVEFIPFIPFPGTKAFNQTPPTINPSLVLKMTRYAFMKFYFRPKIVFRYIRHFYAKSQSINQLIHLIIVTINTIWRFFKR